MIGGTFITDLQSRLWQEIHGKAGGGCQNCRHYHRWTTPQPRDWPDEVRALAATARDERVYCLHHLDWRTTPRHETTWQPGAIWVPKSWPYGLCEHNSRPALLPTPCGGNHFYVWRLIPNPLRLLFRDDENVRNEALNMSGDRHWTPIDPWKPIITLGGIPLRWAYLRRTRNVYRGYAVLYLSFDTRAERTPARIRRILRSRRRDPGSLFSILPKEVVNNIIDFL